MSHSASKLWIHAVWTTKERLPLINAEMELYLYSFISKIMSEIGCQCRILGGTEDHLHCLFLLSPQRSVAEVIKHVKGSSSHFVNFENLISEKFSWQKGYLAFSVSDSNLEQVVGSIQRQREYHIEQSFEKEQLELLRYHGVYPSVNTGS